MEGWQTVLMEHMGIPRPQDRRISALPCHDVRGRKSERVVIECVRVLWWWKVHFACSPASCCIVPTCWNILQLALSAGIGGRCLSHLPVSFPELFLRVS